MSKEVVKKDVKNLDTPVVNPKEEKKKAVELFIARKLATLNTKSGAKYARVKNRLVAKNQEVINNG